MRMFWFKLRKRAHKILHQPLLHILTDGQLKALLKAEKDNAMRTTNKLVSALLYRASMAEAELTRRKSK